MTLSSPVAPQSPPYDGGAVPPPYGPDGTNLPPNPAGPPPYEVSGAAPQKKSALKKIGSIAGVAIVAIAIFGGKVYLRSLANDDPTADAKIGDCISTGKTKVASDKEQEVTAEMATCGTADAAFSIVGRVEHETDLNSKSCDKFFTDEKAEYAVVNSDSGDGYLLCLKKV